MDEVLDLAEKLSRAIARSRRFLDLRRTEKAVMEDEEAVAKIKEREVQRAALAEKEKKVEPIEPGEKRKLAELDEYVRSNPRIGALFKAQADFQEMLNLVNEKITKALGPEPSATPPETPPPTDAPPPAEEA